MDSKTVKLFNSGGDEPISKKSGVSL